MMTDFRKLQMRPTTGAPDSDPGPKGRPRKTGDFRERYNISNLLTNALLPPGEKEWHNKQDKSGKDRGDDEPIQNDDQIQQFYTLAIVFSVVVGGVLIYRYIL